MVQTTLLLLIVSVLAVITLRLAARQGGRSGSTDSKMAILERLPVGNRQTILALRVGERILIVGQSPTSLRTLSELHDDPWSTDNTVTEPNEPMLNRFARMLASPSVKARAAAYTPGPELNLDDPNAFPSGVPDSTEETHDTAPHTPGRDGATQPASPPTAAEAGEDLIV